jgi:hypothetical protein
LALFPEALAVAIYRCPLVSMSGFLLRPSSLPYDSWPFSRSIL